LGVLRHWCPALVSQALINKFQISEGYNHRTRRCCVLAQDDNTSSSDRRAIECPKAENVGKTPRCAVDRPPTRSRPADPAILTPQALT
jgi:hypothetical protein